MQCEFVFSPANGSCHACNSGFDADADDFVDDGATGGETLEVNELSIVVVIIILPWTLTFN